MMVVNVYVALFLRICLVILFPFSALDKIINWDAAKKQAGNIPFKPFMLLLSILVELLSPIGIVTGWHDRIAALVLAGFCVVTALLFHQFWRYPDFWRFKEGEGLAHFWDFLKNFGLVGGLGLIVMAPNTLLVSEAGKYPFAPPSFIQYQTEPALSAFGAGQNDNVSIWIAEHGR